MREIKFRAWLKDEKKIIDVISIDFRIKEIVYEEQCTLANIQQTWYEYRDFNEIDFMQYTGLKDKNGVKIFEGDIVKVYGRTFDNALMCAIAKVVYLDSQFALYMHNQYFAIYSDSCSNYEVIGNIYENKELLENV